VLESCVVAIVSSVLISAAVQDVRTREVSDVHWMVICSAGIVNALSEQDILSGTLMTFGILMLSSHMFSEKVTGRREILVITIVPAIMVSAYLVSGSFLPLESLVMYSLILLLYVIGALRGGADAKVLMSLALAFPAYPEPLFAFWEPVYPEGYVFNPVFSILFLALAISLTYGLVIAWRNLRSGGFSLTSYPESIHIARESFVWPVEDIADGSKVRTGIPEEPDGVYRRLEEAGQ